jgi:hypothetical protein
MKSRTLSKYWKVVLPLLIMVICLATLPQLIEAQGSPPPEAIAACQNKSQGDACAFTAPGGATITGTCRVVQGVLACVPGGGPPAETPTTPTPTATPTATPTPPPSTSTASYPVVDTGQTTCYNNSGAISCPQPGESFYGQDAQHDGNQPSYTLSADGLTVYDNVTGLTWTRSPDLNGDGDIDVDDKLTFADAQTYADTTLNPQNYGGYSDWRLPSMKELYSLMDFRGTDPMPTATDTSQLTPFIDTTYFDFGYGDMANGERIIDAQFWSSNAYVGSVFGNQAAAFGLNLADGRIKGYPTAGPVVKVNYVYFVRGNTDYGINDFTDNRDGTVTDSATGLMWSQDDSGPQVTSENPTGDTGPRSGMTWEEALAWVQQKNDENYLGHSDWRLPNAKEMQSILDYSRGPDATGSAAIDPVFNITQITNEDGEVDYPWFWTSTTHVRFDGSGFSGVYICFGRAMGYMHGSWMDVHGAGAQRSDQKSGDFTGLTYVPDGYYFAQAPQGDAVRSYNYVRLVRDADSSGQNVSPTAEAGGPYSGQPDSPITLDGSGSIDTDGTIALYEWDLDGDGQYDDATGVTASFTASAAGTYTVGLRVTDDGGAQDTDTATVNVAAQGASFEGYNLFSALNSTTAYLMDNDGNIVHSWATDYTPGMSMYLLENSELLHTGNVHNTSFNAGGAGGIVQTIDWDGNVTWEYEYSSTTHLQHHDVEMLPNGNVLLIAWQYKSGAEAIAAGRDPSLLTDGKLWPDSVIEVQPTGPNTGQIVWEWHVWDHLVQDYDPTKENYGVVADHPELIDLNYAMNGGADWNHVNSIDYNAALDQIVLSAHNLSEIWIIDHSTTTAEAASHSGGSSGRGGDLLYRWGNPQAYDAGTAADQQLFGQHDAEWIEAGLPGEGHILVFNNGQGRPGGNYSSIDEIVPPVNPDGSYTLVQGSAYGPAEPIWTYTANVPTDFYAQNISGAQRLPNGNTLICDGPNSYFFEVTASGETVWQYDYTGQVFQVQRYAPEYPGFDGTPLDDAPANQAPIAEAGGPYAGNVGTTIALDGSGSTDNDGTIVLYEWDLDNDGQYDDATGATTNFDAVAAGTYTIGLQVTDNDGATDADTTTVTVTDIVTPGGYAIVDTGQTTFYDNDSKVIAAPSPGEPFYGQDAQYAGNQPSYTLSADGLTVYDNVTGLTWTRSPDLNGDGDIDTNDKLLFSEAQTYADTLNAQSYGGYTDWRLPTIKELYSLIDFSGSTGMSAATSVPYIDTDYFDFAYGDEAAGERFIDAQYWSATEYVGTTMGGSATTFGVNFADGRIKGYGRERQGVDDMMQFVRFVRGNTGHGVNDFVDNGDGTITDLATGLMWSQNDSGVGMNWEEALAWVEQRNAENYLGHNDWRLPNAKELQSIVDYTRSPQTTGSAAIDPIFNISSITDEGGDTDYPFFWSSTTHLDGPDGWAAYVAFGEAEGWMQEPPNSGNYVLQDVHGAGAQRSDPKSGDPADWPPGHGPQGDVVRIYNYVRCVRDYEADASTPTPTSTVTATPIPTATPTQTISQCVRDVNANGIGDIVDIQATASNLDCLLYLPLVTANWRQPWPTPTLTQPVHRQQ